MKKTSIDKQSQDMSDFKSSCQVLYFSPVPACITDSASTILFVNKLFTSLLHCDEKVLTGQSLCSWLHFPSGDVNWSTIFTPDNNKTHSFSGLINTGQNDAPLSVQVNSGKLEQSGATLYVFYLTPVLNEKITVSEFSEQKSDENIKPEKTLTWQQAMPEVNQNCCKNLITKIKTVSDFFREKRTIDSYLKEIAQVINARRVCVFQFNSRFTRIQFVSEWSADPSLQLGDQLWQLDISLYPWWIEQLKNNEYIYIPEVDKLPENAGNEKNLMKSVSIESVIALPLWINYKLAGYIALDITDSKVPVTDFDMVLLQLFVKLIGRYFHIKQYNKYIHQTELRYRKLIEVSFKSFCIHRDGKIIYINKSGAILSGAKSPDELIGRNLLDFLHPEDKVLLESPDNNFAQYKIFPLIEQRFIKLTGELFYVEIASMVINYHGEKAYLSVLRDITERKRMELAIKESEQRYRILFELSPMGNVLTDLEGTILEANHKIAEVLGYSSPREMIESGKKIRDYIIPEQLSMDDENVKELFANGYMKSKEYQLQKVDGSNVTVDVDVLLLMDANNNPVRTIGVLNDISEKKRITQQLLESEKRYRSLAEGAKDMIFIIDREGNVLYVNNFAAQSIGLTATDIIGKKRDNFFAIGDSERQHNHLVQVFITGEAFYVETETVFANQKRWIGSWLVPLKNDQNKVYAVQGISRDITERIIIEKELEVSREKYKQLVENQADLIIKTDADGNILFASPLYCSTFNKTEQQLIGKHFLVNVYYDDRKTTKKIMQTLFTPPHRCYVEQRMLTRDGWRWFSWIETAILDTNQKVIEIIGVGRDMQEQKDMELQLRASEERFRELAELLPEIVYEVDMDNKFTFVNQVALTSTGVTREEFEKGIFAQDMIIPQDCKRMWENRERMINGEPTRNSEYLALRRDGSTFPVIGRSTTIKRNGQIVGFRGVMTNITQLKEAEAALKASEERFRDIIERSIDGYYFINKDGTLEYLNTAAKQIFGFKNDFINIKDLYDVIQFSPELKKELTRKFSFIMGGRQEQWSEIELLRTSGEHFWIGFNSRRVIENGIVKGIEGFIKDITRQKKSEMDIRNSEARYRTLFKNIPFEVFNLAANGQLRDSNIQFREKWSNLLAKNSQQTANDILLLQTIKLLVGKSRKKGQAMQQEYEIHDGNKNINYRMIISPIMISSNIIIGFIGMNIDITDQVLAMEQSKYFSAQLVQLLEEERGRISREIHDSLGQILTALQFELTSASSFLKTDIEQAEQKLVSSRQTLSDAIVEARNLCSSLRPQLLDDFGLEIALKDFIKDFTRRCNVTVEFKSDDLDNILTNDIGISLYRVTQEALNNILKYAKATKVIINLEYKDNNIVFCIKDNGIGFNLHDTEKKEHSHFGLIDMKERIEYLNGQFSIFSEPGKGTKIEAIIPLKGKS